MNTIGEILLYENKEYKAMAEKETNECFGCCFYNINEADTCLIIEFGSSPFECGDGPGVIYREFPSLLDKLKQL